MANNKTYNAVGAGSSANAKTEGMSQADQDALKAAGDAWGNAATQAERDKAHADAEAIRAKYGYSGGSDGSERRDPVTGNKLGSNTNNSSVNNGYRPSYADSYNAADSSGVGNKHAQTKVDMSDSDYQKLTAAGEKYNMYAAQQEQALAAATTQAEKDAIKEFYGNYMDAAHREAEAIRKQYGYSGGEDGSQYIPDQVLPPGMAPSATTQVQPLTNKAPDFTTLLNQWLETAKQQQAQKIDYAVSQGVTELERAKEDAEVQFQTQQDQVSGDEAKALDNQVLYAEARGDRGGIGQAQYGQIQATAMTNRRAINTARTKLATDTARQMADLRAQGEFEKADALLELTQTYLTQLIDLQKWGAEFNLDVDKFNAQLQQWQAEFDMSAGALLGEYNGKPTLENQKWQTSLDQWQQEFNYTTQSAEKDSLANAGWTILEGGIIPSASQLNAMGISKEQAQEFLTALKLAQSNKGKPVSDDKAPDVSKHPLEWLAYNNISADQAEAVLRKQGYGEDYAYSLAEQYRGKMTETPYDKLGAKAKELLSSIERKNDRQGVTGLTEVDQEKLRSEVLTGNITEAELGVMLDLLGY